MTSARLASEWIRFLEAPSCEEAIDILVRIRNRLEGSLSDLAFVLRALTGSPTDVMEDDLRFARAATHDAVELLDTQIRELRRAEPGSA